MKTVPPPPKLDTDAIPDKLYLKIGEVSKLLGIPTYVLRFWESEFRRIRPKRTPAGQRLYRKKDVELIIRIKELLYERRFTIEGAKKHLNTPPRPANPEATPTLTEIRRELESIRKILG